MVGRILIDTNVLLDYLLERELFLRMRKELSYYALKEILTSLCIIFAVESINKAKLLLGLADEGFSDFEDCLQMECAKSYGI